MFIPFACPSGGAIFASATCHCVPMTSCNIKSAAITQFPTVLRMIPSVHRSSRREKGRVSGGNSSALQEIWRFPLQAEGG